MSSNGLSSGMTTVIFRLLVLIAQCFHKIKTLLIGKVIIYFDNIIALQYFVSNPYLFNRERFSTRCEVLVLVILSF